MLIVLDWGLVAEWHYMSSKIHVIIVLGIGVRAVGCQPTAGTNTNEDSVMGFTVSKFHFEMNLNTVSREWRGSTLLC